MAEVIRYVDPDATGAANGTSWTDAYTSLSAWEAAEQTDLVAAGDWHHVWVRASSGTVDTTTVTIDGWVTGASNYILIGAAIGDEALKTGWDTARYRMEVTDASCILINENYVRINGLQLKSIYSGTDFKSVIDTSSWAISTSNDLRVSNCYLTVSGGTYKGIYVHDADAIMTIYNTIVYNTTAMGILNTGTLYLYNSVIYGDNTDYGVQNTGTATIKNCAIFNTTDDVNNSGTVTIDYCASDDGDGTNAVAPLSASWTNEFTDPANGDFTLLNTGNLYQAGADDPSSGLYTTDMEGDAYNVGAYSIGVDEYVAAGGYTITADPGTFALTGQDVALKKDSLISASGGSFIETGQAVNLLKGSLLSAEPGSFLLTGADVGLLKTSKILAESGSFIFSGQTINLLRDSKLLIESGAFILTGQSANLLKGFLLSAESAAYNLTGQNVTLKKDSIVSIGSGSYILTGTAASLVYSGITLSNNLIILATINQPYISAVLVQPYITAELKQPYISAEVAI